MRSTGNLAIVKSACRLVLLSSLLCGWQGSQPIFAKEEPVNRESKPQNRESKSKADHLIVGPTGFREPTEHELKWAQSMMLARRSMMAGSLADAKSHLDKALEETKHFPAKDLKTGVTLWEIGQLHKDRGEYTHAETNVREALSILNEYKSKRPLEYAAALNSLAGIEKDMGKYADAETTYLEVISIVESSPHDPEKLALATSLDNLGVLYQKQKHYHKAINIQKRVLQIYEKSEHVQPRDRAITLNNLAESYQHVGEIEKARGMYLEAIALMEKTYGKMHPSVATFKDNLSAILKEEGKLKEAEELELEVVKIYRTSLGDDHPDLGIALHNLAGLYVRQDDREKALKYEKEALAIFEKSLPKNHHLVVESQAAIKIMESRVLPPLKVPR